MPKISLTAQKAKSLKAIDGKQTDYWDTKTRGLILRVTGRGVKSWGIVYYRQSDKKKRRLTIGKFPAISLADARTKAREFLTAIEQGKDPATEKQDAKKADTFEELANLYMVHYEKKGRRSVETYHYRLKKYVLPVLGHMKAEQVARRDIIILLDEIADRGAGAMSNQILALVRQIYNWAIEDGLLEIIPPTYKIKPRHKEIVRKRFLSPDEIKQLWDKLDSTNATLPVKTITRLCLLTGQRVGEVSGAMHQEIDLKAKIWTLPESEKDKKETERTKNHKAHIVPLCPMALKLFAQAIELSKDSPYIFPSPRKITGRSITAKAAVKAVSRQPNREIIGIDNFTIHDLRRTVGTHLTKLGIERLHVSKLMNHKTIDRETVTGMVYDQNDYMPEKRAALERWENYLTSILAGEEFNVVPFNQIKKNG